MKKALQFHRFADLAPFLERGNLVGLNVGPDGLIYAVVALKPLDYRKESGGPSFAITTPDTPQAYRVFALDNDVVILDVHIAHERFNIHDVQPLPNDELLLVCGRSRYRGPSDFDKNGRVYTTDGQLVREILLGDGISHTQTTSVGTIWTGYFDEGVFGNFGWSDPIGSAGLIAWDSHGAKLYEFEPIGRLARIFDCYALNVETDSSTWLYYYHEFPLVHLSDQRIDSHWYIPISGSGAFAVGSGYVLFHGGYDDRDVYHLFELGHTGEVKEIAQFTAMDKNGKRLIAESVFGRSDALYVLRGDQVYRCDIQMAVGAYMWRNAHLHADGA